MKLYQDVVVGWFTSLLKQDKNTIKPSFQEEIT